MKKFVSIFALVMCAIMLVSLCACTGPSFMSQSKVNSLVKKYGENPQAIMTLDFTSNKKNMRYEITYDLLLDQAPITVVSFIKLVNDGFYQDAVISSYNSSNRYYTAGAYKYTTNEEGGSAKVMENVSSITIPGEFSSNNYPEPKKGYAKFETLFSLAMYHESAAEDFNSANGVLVFSVAKSADEDAKKNANPLNYNNYAVFAKMSSITIYEENSDHEYVQIGYYPGDRMSSTYLDTLTKLTTTTSCNIITADGTSKSESILGSSYIPRFIFSIKMADESIDWSKLPKVN